MGENRGAKRRYAPFEAHRRGDRWRVEVQPEIVYDLDAAAAALALTLPAVPPRFGAKTVRRALRRASGDGNHGDALQRADVLLTDLYRARLLELGVFSTGEGEGANPYAQRLANVRRYGRDELARFRPKVFYDLDEAAAALALVFERGIVRVGRETLQRGLQSAAEAGVHGPILTRAKPAAAAAYRKQLQALGIFPRGE